MPRITWTEEMNQYLIDYMRDWNPEMEYPPVVEGIPRKNVMCQISVLGIGPRHRENETWSDEEIVKVFEHFESGYSCSYIAKKLRRTVNTVKKVVKVIEECVTDKEIFAVVKKDGSIRCTGKANEIAGLFNITENEVRKIGRNREKKYPIHFCGLEADE